MNRTGSCLLAIVAAAGLAAGSFLAGTAWSQRREAAPVQAPQTRGVRTIEGDLRPAVAPRADLDPDEKETIALFENASPSVVFITTTAVQQDIFSLNLMEIPQGSGSGFVWDEAGHVVTNYHVIAGSDAARVTLADHSDWPARTVGVAPERDLAVLKIDVPADRLRPLAIGSSDNLRVGQKVLAIGNPFGLDQTLTTGVISALGREINSLANVPIRDVIQTDAAINPGNSGGPLLDSAGRVIGVNTAIYSPAGVSAGIGFAIPVHAVQAAVPDLITHGRILRPTLGVQLAPDTVLRQAGVQGALVMWVEPGSGADEAGLRGTRRITLGRWQLGDIVVGIDGQPVTSSGDLFLALDEKKPGTRARLEIVRDGRRRKVDVRLGLSRESGDGRAVE